MGCRKAQQLSLAQLGKRIRLAAKDSANVVLTDHAVKRMKARGITNLEVMCVLREGTIRRVPEESADGESLECRMERYVAGRDLAVVVAISDEDPDVVVVTTF